MQTTIGAGLARRLAFLAVAFCAFFAASVHATVIDTRPESPRVGEYVTLELSGNFPRHDFWVTRAVLWELRPEPGEPNHFVADIELYYFWAPQLDDALSLKPFTAHVGLGQFERPSTVEVRVRYYPEPGLPYAFDPTIYDSKVFTVGGGAAACGNELVLGQGTPRCTPSLAFGRYRFNDRSLDAPVIIRNSGREVIYLGDFQVNNADYGFTRRCGETIEPGRQCEVMVTFSPSLDGASPGRLVIPYSNQREAVPFAVAIVQLSGEADIGPVPAPKSGERVVEYHAQATDQYFLTANEREMSLLDGNGNLGWRRTGVTFIASGTFAVCRFFGDPVGGPHGHRYIARVDDCEAARNMDRLTPAGRTAYRYEGTAFSIGLPLVSEYDGRYRCPEGSRPLYQFKRPAGGGKDQAYRIVPAGSVDGGPNGDDIARTLLQAGWAYEGHFMCSVKLEPTP